MNKAWLNPFNPTLKIKTSIVFIGMLFILLVLKSLLFSSSSVGQVDVNRIKGQFIRNLAEHKLSKTKAQAATILFNKALRLSLQEYASAHHLVLVKKGAILEAGSKTKDVTEVLMKEVDNNMRKMSHA